MEQYYSIDACPFIYHSQSSTAETPAFPLNAKKANMTWFIFIGRTEPKLNHRPVPDIAYIHSVPICKACSLNKHHKLTDTGRELRQKGQSNTSPVHIARFVRLRFNLPRFLGVQIMFSQQQLRLVCINWLGKEEPEGLLLTYKQKNKDEQSKSNPWIQQ